MRLNLNVGAERYELFPETKDADGNVLAPAVVIVARPALSEVIESAKADPTLIEHGEEVRHLLEEAAEELDKAAAIKARGKAGVLMSKAIAREVIESWEGIEDPDGSPAPVTPDRVDAFLSLAPAYERFAEVYLARWVTVQHEKNGSAPSQHGTTAGVKNTAQGAQKSAKPARAKQTARKR